MRIRTTFIVGFPGETEEHFEHLLAFIKTHRFDRLGVFTYSREIEVPSGHMENQIKESIKKSRRSIIMKAQHEIATQLNAQIVGDIIPVLIEEYDSERDLYKGRSAWDAPQIDNQVYVKDTEGTVNIGDIVAVKIDKADTYDLLDNQQK